MLQAESVLAVMTGCQRLTNLRFYYFPPTERVDRLHALRETTETQMRGAVALSRAQMYAWPYGYPAHGMLFALYYGQNATPPLSDYVVREVIEW